METGGLLGNSVARAMGGAVQDATLPIGQHRSVLGMTKHMSQVPQLQHKDGSGLYYSHGDCESPPDM